MAIATSYEITYKCGHDATRDLSDLPAGQRAGRVSWLGKQPCWECKKRAGDRKVSKETQAARAAELEEAVADQQRFDLPVLTGSDKQVEWALKVRFNLLRDAYEHLVEAEGASEESYEETVMAPARLIDRSRWWLDNKDAAASDLPELLADSGIGDNSSSENPF